MVRTAVKRAAIQVVATVAAALSPVSATTPIEVDDPARALVAAYNGRDIGAPGWRSVQVDLTDAGVTTQRFSVVNVWRVTPDAIETLFFLTSPAGLHGTAYRQEERPRHVPDLIVHLWLPTARQVLQVARGNLQDGLLGSDFTYEDFRTQLCIEHCVYRMAGQTRMLDVPVTIVQVRRDDGRAAWQRADLYMRSPDGFVLGADYFAGSDRLPDRRMRVERLARRQGVWTAERMSMTRATGRQTTISLLDARFRVPPLPAQAFEVAELTRLESWVNAIHKKIAAPPSR